MSQGIIKKLWARKWIFWMGALSALLVYLSAYSIKSAMDHRGKGWWSFSNGENGEHWTRVSESSYKRQAYLSAALFLAIASIIAYSGVKSWREQDKKDARAGSRN